jgi:hypothetical protein
MQSREEVHEDPSTSTHSDKLDVIVEPGEKDIVFGRGKKYQDHSGNLQMRSFIYQYKEKYHSLKRFHKQNLVENLYHTLVDGGARFLKRHNDTGNWVIADSNEAMQKVCHALRCKKRFDNKRSGENEVGRSTLVTKRNAAGSARTNIAKGLNSQRLINGSLFPSSKDLSNEMGKVTREQLISMLGASERRSIAAMGVNTLGMSSLALDPYTSALTSLQAQDILRREQLISMLVASERRSIAAMGRPGIYGVPAPLDITIPSFYTNNFTDKF